MRAPGKDGIEEDARLFCTELLRAPHVAALFVNAPARLAAKAEEALLAAAKSEARELSALRLTAAGVNMRTRFVVTSVSTRSRAATIAAARFIASTRILVCSDRERDAGAPSSVSLFESRLRNW